MDRDYGRELDELRTEIAELQEVLRSLTESLAEERGKPHAHGPHEQEGPHGREAPGGPGRPRRTGRMADAGTTLVGIRRRARARTYPAQNAARAAVSWTVGKNAGLARFGKCRTCTRTIT